MARISGIDIPKDKRGAIALTYIYGIGKSLALTILKDAKVDQNKKVSDWDSWHKRSCGKFDNRG